MTAILPEDSVRKLKGVGPKKGEALQKLGISTIRDLLYHFPRTYEDRGHIKTLKEGIDGICAAYVLRVVTQPRVARLRGGMHLTTFRAADESGSVEVVFFNQDYISQQITLGETYRFWGRVHSKKNRWQISSPSFEHITPDVVLPDLVPRYRLCEGLSQKVLSTLIEEAVHAVLPSLVDILPEDIRQAEHLPTLSWAMKTIHFPTDAQSLQMALEKVMFDELFCMGIGISLSKSEHAKLTAQRCERVDMTPFYQKIPFSLTGAQKRTIEEITSDMTTSQDDGATVPMRRILIGDVGSGKTVCAAAAAYLTAKNGLQTAIMVPTSILANQHYEELSVLLTSLGFRVVLLTGQTSAAEKRKIYSDLRGEGEHIDVIIGTHALLQKGVTFEKPGLMITDEQHRFGVMQRAELQEKSRMTHLLVMSATPIPRTLALAIYGDLSVSKLDEMPPGRQRVDTYVVDSSFKTRLYAFMRKQIEAGGQVYVVCPSIGLKNTETDQTEEFEEVYLEDILSSAQERSPLKDAISYAKNLAEDIFPEFKVALLHGQMKSQEKDYVMAEFSQGKIDILVSTTVIEVGVNVPNATLMIVENAERFGLSQLHQLRGRVGRGRRKSYCVLVSDCKGENAIARLSTMKQCYDGYQIAEKDLELRGPGDFFASLGDNAVRQSGGLSLTLARCCSDANLLSQAFAAGHLLLLKDPYLSLPEHQALAREVARVFTLESTTIS